MGKAERMMKRRVERGRGSITPPPAHTYWDTVLRRRTAPAVAPGMHGSSPHTHTPHIFQTHMTTIFSLVIISSNLSTFPVNQRQQISQWIIMTDELLVHSVNEK